MSDGGNTVPRVVKAEHIGPTDTGDNIEAKRVAMYVETGAGQWARATAGLFTKPYDEIIIDYTDNTKTVISTITTKLNGSTQETITNSSTATRDDLVRS